MDNFSVIQNILKTFEHRKSTSENNSARRKRKICKEETVRNKNKKSLKSRKRGFKGSLCSL